MHRSVHKALSLPIAVHSSVKNRMGIKAKLLLLVALMVGTVSVVAQKTTKQPTTQTTTNPPITGNTCQVLQGPPGPPGTCSYTEVSLVKGVRDISTSLKESVKNLTEELRESTNDLRETLHGGLQKLNDGLMDALGKIQQGVVRVDTGEPSCPRSLGLSSYKPAMSCREILRCNPSSPSGYYWLKSATTECREVYCDMDTTHCNITGGWMRLAYLNMTEPGASCPTSLRQINTPAKLCGRRTAPGCSGVTYPVDGIRYSKVCGQARGYQYHSTDAFQPSTNNINSHYVDGVSITYGSPRHHLWTFGATGSWDGRNNAPYTCPCAKYPGDAPPDFVGLDYFCESKTSGHSRQIALDDPLWDGKGCGRDVDCCAQAGMPWFYRTLPQEVSEDVEVRVCADQNFADEEVYVELVEVYIQ